MVERIKNKKGFTIIEVMVVIALIGILAAVLVPQFAGVKDTARDTGMLTNVKMVEAYVASVIDGYTTAEAGDLVTAIEGQFDGDDALTNPYTGLAEDDNIVVTTGEEYSNGDTATSAGDAGVIYVVVDDDQPLTVYINGFDSEGIELENTQRTVVR